MACPPGYIRRVQTSAWLSVARYLWRAQTIYDVHAPLAYGFIGEVVEDRRHFYAFDRIAERRDALAEDRTALTLDDRGAGSQRTPSPRRTVAEIVRASATPPRFGRYLHKAVEFTGARRVLELGTNLGIGTAYLATALPRGGRMITIEADAGLLPIARETVATLAPHAEVELLHGTFDERLGAAIAGLGAIDLAFVDGHHLRAPTVDYFRAIAAACHERSVVIVDDIHWSAGMEAAWRTIQAEPGVTLTIDLQRFGVVFFNPGVRSPQHLTIVPSAFKPWRMGFFAGPRHQPG